MAKVLSASAISNGARADYARPYFHVTVPTGTAPEDVLRPGFWAHHANQLPINTLIDILSEDSGLDMQVRVIGRGIGMVHMRPLRIWVREETAQAKQEEGGDDDDAGVPEGYTVNFAPRHSWRVIRDEPHAIISTGHKSRAEAVEAAVSHHRAANTVVAA